MQIAEAKRKEAADEEAKKRKQEQYNFRVVNQYNSAQNVIDQIDESIEMANAVGSTGLIGATVALVPGTPQFDLSQKQIGVGCHTSVVVERYGNHVCCLNGTNTSILAILTPRCSL